MVASPSLCRVFCPAVLRSGKSTPPFPTYTPSEATSFLLEAGHPLSNTDTSYFATGAEVYDQDEPSSWNPLGESFTSVEWQHTIGAIVTGVAQAGLRITHLTEFPDDAGMPGEYMLRAVKAAPDSRT